MNEVEDHYLKDAPVEGCRCTWCEAARGEMNFRVKWSDEDQEWVGTVDEYPSLSWLHVDRQAALNGIRELAYSTRDDIAAMQAKQAEQKCAELKCPCGCGNVVMTRHAPNCPDDCPIG